MYFILSANIDPAGGGSPWMFVRQYSQFEDAEKWVKDQPKDDTGWSYTYIITQKVG